MAHVLVAPGSPYTRKIAVREQSDQESLDQVACPLASGI
jgi:hypothetical protein